MQPPYYLLARPPLSATYYEHEYCVRVVVSRRGVASFFFFFVRHLLPDLPVFYPSGEDYLPMFRKYVPKKEQTGNSRSGSLVNILSFWQPTFISRTFLHPPSAAAGVVRRRFSSEKRAKH